MKHSIKIIYFISKLCLKGAGLVFVISGISGCGDKINFQEVKQAEISGCQSCHRSPPPTGEHDLHLFKQVHRPQITCVECHGSSVKKMLWKPTATHRYVKKFLGWQQLVPGSTTDSAYLLRPLIDTAGFWACSTEVRGPDLYSAKVDSFFQFIRVISPGDSVELNPRNIIIFPLQSSIQKIDTIADPVFGTLFDTSVVNIYGESEPVLDRCQYSLVTGSAGDSLFEMSIPPKSNLLLTLGARDSLFISDDLNKIFVLSPDFNVMDTTRYASLDPSQTFLGQVDEGLRQTMTTVTTWGEVVLKGQDGFFYQVQGDSLYLVQRDSTIFFEDNIFAENTSYHLNGLLDIFFNAESTTLYQAETTFVFKDSITGDIIAPPIVKRTGAWLPQKQTCWNENVSALKCHDRLSPGWTNWYRPD